MDEALLKDDQEFLKDYTAESKLVIAAINGKDADFAAQLSQATPKQRGEALSDIARSQDIVVDPRRLKTLALSVPKEYLDGAVTDVGVHVLSYDPYYRPVFSLETPEDLRRGNEERHGRDMDKLAVLVLEAHGNPNQQVEIYPDIGGPAYTKPLGPYVKEHRVELETALSKIGGDAVPDVPSMKDAAVPLNTAAAPDHVPDAIKREPLTFTSISFPQKNEATWSHSLNTVEVQSELNNDGLGTLVDGKAGKQTTHNLKLAEEVINASGLGEQYHLTANGHITPEVLNALRDPEVEALLKNTLPHIHLHDSPEQVQATTTQYNKTPSKDGNHL